MMNTKFGLPQLAILKIQSVFQNFPQVDKVILFGSRAMDTYRNGSDIDLCIESNNLTLTDLLAIENQLDDLLLPWKIDLILKNTIDNPALLTHIDKHGIIFYP
jgi:uncharacterized protein